MATIVRITSRTQATLRLLSAETGESMQEIADKAVEAYRRQRILDRSNAAYAAMRENPRVWQEEVEERAAWDATLTHGLEDD